MTLALPPLTPARGDVSHLLDRVHHCDALQLLAALPDASVDIVVTSPPYNADIHIDTSGIMKGSKWIEVFKDGYDVHDDNMPEPKYQAWIASIVRESMRVSKGLTWVNHKTRYRDGVAIHPLSFMPFPLWSEVVWDRGGSITLNSRRFAPSHEYVFGFGRPHYWKDKLNTLMSVWRIVPKHVDDGHPCPYPETLIERLIEASCPPDGTVFDPFGGSGTTAAVAQRLGRHYIIGDNSHRYCDMMRKRLEMPYNVRLPLFEEAS